MKNPIILVLGAIALGLVGWFGYLMINQPQDEPEPTEQTLPPNEPTTIEPDPLPEPEPEPNDPEPPLMFDDVGEGMEFPTPDDEPVPAKVFNVTGVNFAYNIEEIRVQEGDTVIINFESEAGFHDWVVDEFNAATEQVRPGKPTSVTFVADKAGVFEYYCAVPGHRTRGMVGNLIVEPAS